MKKFILIVVLLIPIIGFGQKEYFITSEDQTKLFVREFGTGDPIVLLAGGPGLNANYLRPVWENLSSNFRCIVLDQRGTGKSLVSSVDSASMSMRNYINDINALLEYLKLQSIYFVGHSWGGMLAMEYAANQPEKVLGMILLGPGGPTQDFFSYFGDNLFMRLNKNDLNEMALLDSMNKSNLQAIWPGYFYDRKMAMESKLRTDFNSMHGQPDVYKFTISNYISRDTQRTNSLKVYKGQVEIIQGRQDPIGESTVYEILEILPQTQISFIEQCGHLPWLEREEQKKKFYSLLNNALNP